MLIMSKWDSGSFLLLLATFIGLFNNLARANVHHYTFVIERTPITRLCQTHNKITVNGQYPGPTLHVRNGDTLIVKTYNRAQYNATIHWHGVRQLGTAWADGTGYITQCPIQPHGRFTYRFTIVGQEGTLWWHAHVSWLRATVHGALVIYPKRGSPYPFPQPYAEIPLVLGDWWNSDPEVVVRQAIISGGAPNISDAFTINGQPGDLYPCSTSGTFNMSVKQGKTYLLRIVNAALNSHLFFKIASHNLTVVAADASYTKPYTTDVMFITPGQSTDVLLTANQPVGRYYIAASVYTTQPVGYFDNTTTTAIINYEGSKSSATPILPQLPVYNDTATVTVFSRALRSLASPEHPIDVPQTIDKSIVTTVGLNLLPCPLPPGMNCSGPNNTRIAASMNNISFVLPDIAILQAYYFGINGIFTIDFPSNPPLVFNYTGDNIPKTIWAPTFGTKIKVFNYNDTVQVVYQGTNIFQADDHPMHLHGYDFFVVGQGFGNYNDQTDPLNFNLVDPPLRNTLGVPLSGWAAIRFKADNPGAWFLHCHFDDHLTWGLNTVFVVNNGPSYSSSLEPPPPDLPRC
ncbi:laccase-12 [Cryptomeria japonica]|uniref:laccase-12 n=1 Tax=Cryptomeria japonica TaxID=3369 RepID=UPI0027DA94D6|nr:laccase-12 [Cryptomeria japonica]